MIEIRFHGRGGQGAVTAAELLAVAAFKDGKFSQAFGAFGPERRGAPVTSFCRIDDKFIRIRQQVYNPNIIVVLDSGLLQHVNIIEGVGKEEPVIINCTEKHDIKADVHVVDATKFAREIVGKNIVNTAMLGALAKVTNIVSLKSLEEAVKERFGKELAAKNIELMKKTYEAAQ
jgi:pyruvate ferredoxin oxidoreductase gamma subunit